jgi:hypothetical protein
LHHAQTETFGPVLCVLPVKNIDDAVNKYNIVSGKYPLAFYAFSNRKAVQEELLVRMRSGGATVNDCVVHAIMRDLPFGSLVFHRTLSTLSSHHNIKHVLVIPCPTACAAQYFFGSPDERSNGAPWIVCMLQEVWAILEWEVA